VRILYTESLSKCVCLSDASIASQRMLAECRFTNQHEMLEILNIAVDRLQTGTAATPTKI